VLIAVVVVLLAAVASALWVRGPWVLRWPDPIPDVAVSEDRLKEAVQYLSVDLGPRWYTNVENLDRASRWIEAEFLETGLELSTQSFRLMEGAYRNVIARKPGTDPGAGVVIVGAHYDAYGEMPGADDNASGVAVLLELARTLPAVPCRRTRLLVAFANEEPPLFGSEDMGSARFARKLVDEKTPVDLMIALDLVGYFSDEPGSQHTPIKGLGLVYPSTGNFIAVVGDMGAGRWIKKVKRGMMRSRALPVVSFRAPAAMPGVHFSDHMCFRRLNLPGVLVSDTAFLRTPHYHRTTDTIRTLDFHRMALVVKALHGVLYEEDLSDSD
jgi:hypothetical protein